MTEASRHRWPSSRRLLFVAGSFLVALALAPLAIVRYPNPMFPHEIEVGNLSLYSDAPIEAEVAAILLQVQSRVELLEIDSPNLRHRLFLCRSARRYAFFARVLGVSPSSQGVNAPLVHSVFLSQPFLDEMRSRFGSRYKYSLLEGDLVHVATHEIVHTLVTRRLGFFESRRLPHWKREGYAEYASIAAALLADPDDDLRQRLKRFEELRSEDVGAVRMQYLRAQLLVEYLMSVEGLTFDQLMSTDLSAATVYGRLQGWTASLATERSLKV